MPTTQSPRTLDERARLGSEFFDRRVKPTLRPEQDGQFVAIDVGTGDFEIDADDYAAVTRLLGRNPADDIWLVRVGFPTTCRMGSGR